MASRAPKIGAKGCRTINKRLDMKLHHMWKVEIKGPRPLNNLLRAEPQSTQMRELRRYSVEENGIRCFICCRIPMACRKVEIGNEPKLREHGIGQPPSQRPDVDAQICETSHLRHEPNPSVGFAL